MNKSVTIIDYGVGNLLSVTRAFEHCGAKCIVTGDPEAIATASALVLPGVGAFRDGMAGLASSGLIGPILTHARAGRPLLGICLGMQMLASSSEEFGDHHGLDLIPGRVRAIPTRSTSGVTRKTPFIGWARLHRPEDADWTDSPLEPCTEEDSIYLVHSFHLEPEYSKDLLATYEVHGDPITAAVRHGNITGLQFHPEKSGVVGLKILKKFVEQVELVDRA